MYDTIETMGHSLIQHGPSSQRIYLMKLDERDMPGLLGKLDALAQQQGYSKIFAKAPGPTKGLFEAHGYLEEAAVPNFYNGQIEGVFLGKYIDPERELDPAQKQIEAIVDLAETKAVVGPGTVPLALSIRRIQEAEVEALAAVYREVFESYPFPIHEPDYLLETMNSHVQYFGVYDGRQLVAAGSAEMDIAAQNAEMTDFATLPSHRGKGLALHLLDTMEHQMRDAGILTGYTIARSVSAGMNITFAKLGYHFAGTLTNNTNICGNIESMNVWYKPLNEG